MIDKHDKGNEKKGNEKPQRANLISWPAKHRRRDSHTSQIAKRI
jgi:hypothetical protein